jgi:hypothetical protein
VGGEDVLDTLEKLSRKEGTERPVKPVKITEVVMYVALSSAVSIAEERYLVIKTPSRTTKFGWPRNSRRKRRRRTQLVSSQQLQKRSQAMA